MRKKVVKVTKVTKLLKVSEILGDMLSDVTDEELLEKYRLSWKQLEKIYSKLFYGGFLDRDQLRRRSRMRAGRPAFHIPLAEIDNPGTIYECLICGYSSLLHFSVCPRCRQINLRRLTRQSAQVVAFSRSGQHAVASS
ncbi:MAG: hypothetical protein WBG50_00080 [Desulfomonilaceae bacterium]